jgi:heptosyltransferase-2
MWIGDFVRCHSVVKLLRTRWPNRPIDLLTSGLCAPLLDYMPGVRKGIVSDLPRRRLPLGQYRTLADTLRAERYGTAVIIPSSPAYPSGSALPVKRVSASSRMSAGVNASWSA